MSDEIKFIRKRINSDGTISELVAIPKKMLELEAKGVTSISLAKLRKKYTEEETINFPPMESFEDIIKESMDLWKEATKGWTIEDMVYRSNFICSHFGLTVDKEGTEKLQKLNLSKKETPSGQ